MNILLSFLLSALILQLLHVQVEAQFGLNNKKKEAAPNNPVLNDLDDPLLDFNGDPELQDAIQAFADMSNEEMIETMKEMKELLKDDPEALAELDEVIAELSQMDSGEIQEGLEQIMAEEAVAYAMEETIQLLQNADDGAWEKILEQKDLILDNIIESGIMSPEETAIFKDDPAAWEEELTHIWTELKAEASAHAESSSILDEL
jgi:predicted RND superfamily exporter protein